jgi:hypothetical protein
MSEIRVGTYVHHALRPGWGLGKVFGRSGQHVLVGFLNVPESERFKRLEWREGLLEPAPVEADPVLDSWTVECDSTCHHIAPAARKSRRKSGVEPPAATWTLEKVWERFTQKFHGGLNDEYYLDGERKWRVAQHTVWTETIAARGLREMACSSPDEVGRLIVTILESARRPLLHPRNELPALKEVLSTPAHARTFVNALADLIEAPALTANAYNGYVRTLTSLPRGRNGGLVRWAIVSAMPSIAQPERHMFVKPAAIQRAAASLAFNLDYTPTPQWHSYQCMLAFGTMVLDFLKPLGGRDFIDAQGFTAVLED